jgi:hypothetical protein
MADIWNFSYEETNAKPGYRLEENNKFCDLYLIELAGNKDRCRTILNF